MDYEENDNSISVSVRVRLKHSLNVDNNSLQPTYVSSHSKQTFNTRVSQPISNCIKRSIHAMKLKSKQICLILAIIITLFVAIHNGTLRTRKSPNPTKFFDESSFVVDYEFGDLKQLSIRALQNDVSFVMYYAHWDSECIRVKKEYETIAKHYSYQIFFASINCWWPEGECRKYYNLRRYPVMLANVRMAGEVEYKGPIVASYMIPFLDNLLDPVVHIQNEGDLLDLRSKHDAVLVGFFDFNESPQPPGYKKFFSLAVKALVSDPWRSVSYCVISSRRIATKMSLTKPSTLTLFLWNTTEQYSSKSFKIQTILSWVYSRVQQVPSLRWLTPSGVKSSALSDILTKSPTFVLFTPRSFVLGISPYFDVLKEVVMDYHNCDNSPLIRSVIHRSILRRHLLEEKLMELDEKCHEMMENNSLNLISTTNRRGVMESDSCCHSQTVRWRVSGKGSDKKCFCTACVHLSLAKCPANCQRFNCLATASRFLSDFDPNSINSTATYCNHIRSTFQPKYTSYYRIVTTCSGTHPTYNELDDKYFITDIEEQSNSHNDEKVGKMIEDSERQHCHRLNLGLKYSDLNFPDSAEGNQFWRTNFTGLSCRANRTLKFAALDSILFPAFAENLGIDVFNETHASVGVIVDNSNENIYVLSHESSDSLTINKRSLVEFIKNFTSGSLPRFFKSTVIPLSSGLCLSENKERVICVPEISSETFTRVVLDRSKDVILMYYAPWCGFCSSIAHIYLDVARLFVDVQGIVFARINGDANDLPFEYTVDRYPTILFFPAKRKMDSISFPANTPISTTSLVQFILMNSQSHVRLQITLQLCNRRCLLNNLFSSRSHIRSFYRRLRNRYLELNIVREKIKDINSVGKKLTKKLNNQLKELRLYSTFLIDSIRHLRQSSAKVSLLNTFIIDRIQKYEINSKKQNHKSLHDIIKVFDHKSTDGKSSKINSNNSNKTKSKLTNKTLKYSTQTLKKSLKSKTKDEL